MDHEWLSQIKRGTLEYSVILLIKSKDRYGYELIQILEDYPMLKTKESTIYPLLRRLQKNGYLDSYWDGVEEGASPRKYYRITAMGIEYLNELNRDWQSLIESIIDIGDEHTK